jgi:hypothetical protein
MPWRTRLQTGCAASWLIDTPDPPAPQPHGCNHARQEHMQPANRRLVHTRSIRVDAYVREDKLWDLVASIKDVKTRELELQEGTRPAGAALHDMTLTVTIDAGMTIVAVDARTDAAPFNDDCKSFPQVYQALVGLNLLQKFRAAVRERLGGERGCTHITELTAVLPTAAIQAFAGEVIRPDKKDGAMPPHLNRCHALRLDGPVVARYYPRWYAGQNIEQKPGEQA